MRDVDVHHEQTRARRFWSQLRRDQRNDIGDELVLGTFDWRSWFTRQPSRAFLDALDHERILWESTDAA